MNDGSCPSLFMKLIIEYTLNINKINNRIPTKKIYRPVDNFEYSYIK